MRVVRPSSYPSENYSKERNETQMENTRPRGRLATSRLRDKQLSSNLISLPHFDDTQFAIRPYTLHKSFDNHIQISLR